MEITIKAFITSKSEYRIGECQDRFAINTEKGIFAIADGVSQSLLPAIWAKTLVDTFVINGELVQKEGQNDLLSEYYINYENRYSEEIRNLSDSQREFLEYQRESVDFGASTFLGVKINNEEIEISCIGDSILFLYRDHDIKHCCSMSDGDNILFDNSPQYLASNKTHNGSIITKSVPLTPCTLFLMTDALADWFYHNNGTIENIQKVANISDNNEFCSFIDNLRRKSDLKDDDTTLLVLNLADDDSEGLKFHTIYCDDITTLQLRDFRNENQILQKDLAQYIKDNENIKLKLKEANTKIKELSSTNNMLEDKIKKLSSLNAKKDNLLNQIKRLIKDETF